MSAHMAAVALPSKAIDANAERMIRDSNTAYSTAVGPLSSRKKAKRDRMGRTTGDGLNLESWIGRVCHGTYRKSKFESRVRQSISEEFSNIFFRK